MLRVTIEILYSSGSAHILICDMVDEIPEASWSHTNDDFMKQSMP